jgi:hypothetical protein
LEDAIARYGHNFKYGDHTKYGTGDPVPQPTPSSAKVKWIVLIDWTGNGFTGFNEAAYCLGMTVKRGREFYIASGADNFESMRVWPSTLVMDNSTGRYDPYNTAGPLYPYVRPGRRVQIQVRETSDGTTHDILTGHIADIQPDSGNDRQVIITINDGMQWLNDQMVDMTITLHSTISAAIDDILNRANYPFGRDVQTWAQPIPVFDAAQYNAADTVNDLASGSLGTFFIAADGTAKYYPLSYAPSPLPTLDQANLLKEIQVASPWENVRNRIEVESRRRGQYPLAAIWSSGGGIAAPANSNYTMGISFPDAIGVRSVLRRQYDFIANTSSDGTGTDITGRCLAALLNITSTSATLRISNFTAATAYITFIQVWGCKLVDITVKFASSDAGSIDTYGPRRFQLKNPWLQDSGYARAFSVLLKDFLSGSQKNPVIRIEAREDIQYDMDLMDTIPLTVAKLGIGASFRVGGIEHEWLADNNGNINGQSVLTTLYLQKVIYSAVAIVPDPYYPPAIPPVVPPYTPPTPPTPPEPPEPPPPGDTTCTTDMAALPNGPFALALGGNLYSVTLPSRTADYACILRAAGADNKSTIVINGTFEYTDDGGTTWKPLPDNDDITIEALDASDTVIAYATMAEVTDPGPGSRAGVFSPVAASAVAKFRISLAGSDVMYYIYGAPIASGAIPVTEEHGVELLDGDGYHLASGLYAVQGKTPTGPWYYGLFPFWPFESSYGIQEGVYLANEAQYMSYNSSGGTGVTYFEGTTAILHFPWESYGWIIFDCPGVMPDGAQLASLAGTHNNVYAQLWLGLGGTFRLWRDPPWDNFPGTPAVETLVGAFDQIKITCGYIADVDIYFSVTPPATYTWGDGLYLDETVVAPRTRIYFSAVGVPNKDLVRVKDTPGEFENNSGGEDYELYHAGSAGTVHLAINSVLLYNVCPPE